ncbi:hypothetical protein DRW48_05610 [Paracoccus suum]|uniref:FMN-binding glutamate synthase family protein n=1 Tax=Paracoccus suum TaxID=2259340 RepID=A0A344PIM3_9RHOB|nr:hypothetical protein [Paracoccus suum]AXC49228.1 hypothetical protein DRW48_05610 [Paracoccus suum]
MDLLKRASIPVAALAISLLAILLARVHSAWLWLLVICVPLMALGIYDFAKRTWVITRNYPGAGQVKKVISLLRENLLK